MRTAAFPPLKWPTHPSALLLMAQLVSLLLYAAFDGNPSGRAVLVIFGVLVLALVVWVVDRSPALDWVAWVLVVPAILISLLSIFFGNPLLLVGDSLLLSVIYFYGAGSMVAYMMKDLRATTDELFAAGATYTLLAWGFAHAYMVCQLLFPNSFTGLINPEQPRTFVELLSLSFTNLTSTGLGDVMPITPFARVLVMLEQSAGIGYVAVVVSRLIGMTLIKQQDQENS